MFNERKLLTTCDPKSIGSGGRQKNEMEKVNLTLVKMYYCEDRTTIYTLRFVFVAFEDKGKATPHTEATTSTMCLKE